MASVLERIVADTRSELSKRKVQVRLATVQRRAETAPKARDFAGALRGDRLRLIAEIKRASPSKGTLRGDLDPAKLARRYAEGGATATSVLTDGQHFAGSLDDLAAVRAAVDLPVLRKDFIVDEYQVYEARAYGADALLLIAAVLPADRLAALLAETRALGMEALVETHNATEIEMALGAGAKVVGVNNRNLADFTVDLATTERLRPLVPPQAVLVSESGVRTAADARRLRACGVDAILVGEALVTAPNVAAKIRELVGWQTT
ncbi:MAG: indole-3-glycerol phosphate synthase TrpC [Bacteroidetes bacterium]|nr:indole-3-glycerol phosphate synthase TrpC [Bacteroidota bacterium]MCL5026220.1 indole-3-glycerol phosphate synthase TrpC [Chloroflexota bacterium]